MKYSVVHSIHPRDMSHPHRASYIRRSIRGRYAGVIYTHTWSPVYGWIEHALCVWVHPHTRGRHITFKVCI